MIFDNHMWRGRALRIAVGIMMLALLLPGGAGAATITVDDSGGADYTRIQDAINNATAGDTIEVYSGTYYENVNVNMRLTLSGIGMPVVDADGSGNAITLAADGIRLEGFTATGGGSYYREAGVKVTSNSNTLNGNNASNNYYGIYLLSSSNNTLFNNNAISNNVHDIYLKSSSNNTLTNNNALYSGYGIYLLSSSNNTLISNNALYNVVGIFQASSSNNTFIGNNVSNQSYGIYLDHSNNNTLIGNNALNNTNGIFLYPGNNNTLVGNNASKNTWGIYLGASSNNTLIGNNATSNNVYGIYLQSSSSNTLIRNNVLYNAVGISLDNYLNTFYRNNNKIFNNNLRGNTNQAIDTTNANIWDSGYPPGGNYWNDYLGVDLNSGPNQDIPGNDGIGDTPYYIGGGAGAQDKYPLMAPYTDLQPTPSTITLISPNGEENWQAGTTQNIQWTYTGSPGDFVDIQLLKNGEVVEGVGACVLTSEESFTLSTPLNQIPGTDYKVRITSTTNNVYTDTSDENFSIHATQTTELKQFKSDGTTQLTVRSATAEHTVVFSATVNDSDSDNVKLQIELRRNDEYDNIFDENKGGLKNSSLVTSGSLASISVSDLIYGNYHWRARTIDENENKGEWVEFGDNPTSYTDFIVVEKINEILIVKTSFANHNVDFPISEIENIKDKVTQYYLDSSYKSEYLNFTIYHQQIIIKNKEEYDRIEKSVDNTKASNIAITIMNDATAQLKENNVNMNQYNTIVINLNKYDYIIEFKGKRIFDQAKGINVIYVERSSNFIHWAHEIGHTYGIPDLAGNGNGNIYYWGVMGRGPDVNPPTQFSSFSKFNMDWLRPKQMYINEEIKLTPLEKSNYRDPAYIYKWSDSISYIIEARDLQPNEIKFNYYHPFVDRTLEDGVVIYKVENLNLYTMQEYPNVNWVINSINYGDSDDPALYADITEYTDLSTFVKFQLISTSNTPYYQPTVRITQCDICDYKKGIILHESNPSSDLDMSILPQSYSSDFSTSPDLDLHAYTPDEKHVGMNYVSGEYEMQIPGASASGDLSNGEEWIFVPKDTEVRYYVDSHDVQKYLEENSDINATNATMKYSTTFMEYGENPQMEQLPDGNWTVTNRTVSEPQNFIIEPGVIKEIIPEPPASIRNLTFEAGSTWLNFTWLNPPNPDYDHVMLYLNSTFKISITAPQNYYNFTGLEPNTVYELGTHTVDSSGNVNQTWVNATARTAPLEFESIQVTNPSANPTVILNDNGRVRPPGTNITRLNVTVTGGVASVTIDLSPIGRSATSPMPKISGTDNFTLTSNATACINMNLTHHLVVNATDINGTFNDSVSIPLTVLMRGDINSDCKIDLKDLLFQRRYLAILEPSINSFVADIQPAEGDGKVDLKDLLFLRRYLAGLETWI